MVFLRTSLAIIALFSATFSSIDSRLYNRCVKSVVYIASDRLMGTGVVIDKHHIITNHHVISGSQKVRILPYDKNSVNMSPRQAFQYKNSNEYNFIDGEVIAIDPVRDLAMIKTTSRLTNITNLASSYSSPKIHDDVFAIGNPATSPSLFNSTKGSVSALPENVEFSYAGDMIPREANLIQTPTPINGGNSGGPLFNERGYVVGLTTWSEPGAQGTNFAIHINEIQDFIKKAKKGEYPSTNTEWAIFENFNLWKEFKSSTKFFYGYPILKAMESDKNNDGKRDGYCYWIDKTFLPDYCKYNPDFEGDWEIEVYYYRKNLWPGSTIFRPRYLNDRYIWRLDSDNDRHYDTCLYDDDGSGIPETIVEYEYYKGYFWKTYP
tara:strand:- start:277 stop:1410 length:1134 start_codon:yes stop_codon:yes gene_type:complete